MLSLTINYENGTRMVYPQVAYKVHSDALSQRSWEFYDLDSECPILLQTDSQGVLCHEGCPVINALVNSPVGIITLDTSGMLTVGSHTRNPKTAPYNPTKDAERLLELNRDVLNDAGRAYLSDGYTLPVDYKKPNVVVYILRPHLSLPPSVSRHLKIYIEFMRKYLKEHDYQVIVSPMTTT